VNTLTNGDFSNGLDDWEVTQGGATAPTADPATGGVIFGSGANDVQNTDSISQSVELTAGEEFSLTLTLSQIGASGGGALTIDLIDNNSSGTMNIGTISAFSGESNTVTFTFDSPFDSAVLLIRGQFAFGGEDSFLLLDDIDLSSTSAVCFTKGTMIQPPTGTRLIETLKVGDLVETLDRGPQAIRWIGTTSVRSLDNPARYKLRPILIRAGALGAGLPNVDMRVSRQHRMLVSSKIAERMFDVPQVLVPAVRLLALDNVEIDHEVKEVEYLHFIFDQHEIIWANGAPAESLFLGQGALNTLQPEAREELKALFPELLLEETVYEPVRNIPRPKRQKRLIERHVCNAQHIVSNEVLGHDSFACSL